jgi:hypothetical protein
MNLREQLERADKQLTELHEEMDGGRFDTAAATIARDHISLSARKRWSAAIGPLAEVRQLAVDLLCPLLTRMGKQRKIEARFLSCLGFLAIADQVSSEILENMRIARGCGETGRRARLRI